MNYRIFKKALTVFFILLFGFSCNAQKLKKKFKSSGNPVRNETYYVLKEDKSIRHGDYVSKTPGGKIVKRGFYNYGKKDGIWTIYYVRENSILSICRYQDDEPVGVLLVNDRYSRISYLYDYSINEITEYHWYENSPIFPVQEEDVWIQKEIDNPPVILGVNDPRNIIMSCFKLPYQAGEFAQPGEVIIGIVIDEKGNREEARLIEGIHEQIDKELLRCVNSLEKHWYPAKKDGVPVICDYHISLGFGFVR